MKAKLLSQCVITAIAATAGSAALAGNVQLFGFLDQGLAYIHEDLNAGMGGPVGQSKALTVGTDGYVSEAATKTMVSQGTGNVSTWGIKGSEALSDDTEVIFHLESGFLPDDGTLYGAGSPIFERESSVGIRSKTFGELKAGRMPALTTGSGTTGIFNSKVNPFGAGWGNMTGGWKFTGTLATARWNNMINYISPSFGGVRIHLQHSLGNSNDATEGTSDTNRWSAAGLSWTAERFYLAAAVDWLRAANNSTTMDRDTYKVLVGGHYKFDSFKLFGSVQYLKNAMYIGGYSTKEFAPLAIGQKASKGFESWALATGVDIPVAGGTLKASVGYGRGENQSTDSQNRFQRANAGLGYLYPLSRRTTVYAVGGYFWQDADWQRDSISANEVILGLMHRF